MYFKTLAHARWSRVAIVTGSSLALSLAFSLPASAASKISVPTAVRAVQATAGNARAVVKWSAPKSNGGSPIKRYVVTSHPLNKTCTTKGAKCAISGLTNGMTYEFTVVAGNKVGSSSNSKPSNVVTPGGFATIPISPPSSPVPPSTPTTTTTTISAPSGGGGGGDTTPSSYTVTFNANGSSGSMASETSSSAAALTTNVLTLTGYTFSGWNTAANGSGTAYADRSSYIFGASVTLYAQWSADFFAVTFSANGGSGSMTAQSDNTTTALSANSFTRSGYTFSGWNTQANGSGTVYAGGASYGFGANVTLYAQWAAASAPVVTLSPTSQVVGTGNTATFNASASGSPTPSVQWNVSSNGGSSWSAISGATSTSYAVSSTPFVNGYEYEAVFTNSGGTATSGAAQLTFLANSVNWAGYVDTGGTFSAVSAKWVVPTVTCSGTSALVAVQWVGIDGFNSSTVEQDGTETSCAGSTPQYSAWYEMFGDANVNGGYMVPLSTSLYHVSPGNSMTASVLTSGGQWTLKVVDNTAGWTFSTVITSSAPTAVSAEVITESPVVCTSSCSEAALANFGTVTFTNISVTSSTTGTGSITSSTATAVECNDSNNLTMMSPGVLSGGGTSFTDTWISSS